MLTYDQTIVTKPNEVFLLSLNTSFQFGWVSIYFVVGPLFRVFKATTQLLAQMKEIAQQEAPLDSQNAAPQ
jgi:hypothetical protein